MLLVVTGRGAVPNERESLFSMHDKVLGQRQWRHGRRLVSPDQTTYPLTIQCASLRRSLRNSAYPEDSKAQIIVPLINAYADILVFRLLDQCHPYLT